MLTPEGAWAAAAKPPRTGRNTERQPTGGADQILKGPNVCGFRYRRYCCAGWTTPPGSNRCIVPICKGDCGQGTCMRPNLCLCPNGQIAPSCVGLFSCAIKCLNGGTCQGSTCLCPPGFQGPYCGQPICGQGQGCLNGGRCIEPGRCACLFGYTGDMCEADYRTGPCFTQISNNMCRGQLIGVVCTKMLCCATIGKAWGNPCEQCPDEPSPCQRGYILNIKSSECQDIDECQAIPGLCVGGKCINTLGSYSCECEEGQRKNELTNACEDIDECSTIPNVCANGECHNTEGSYFCKCHSGYELSPDRTSCQVAEKGYCYQDLINNMCRNPLSGKYTLNECCCIYGKGWSSDYTCHVCPDKDSEQYKEYCGEQPVGDYCSTFPGQCANGVCQRTPGGSYRCVCNPGYRESEPNVCTDINECDQTGICYNGICVNTEGSFRCNCKTGYKLSTDGTYCTDMDECEHSGMCPNGECINMDGSYKCVCKPGYKQSPNQQICIDIDECNENGRLCLNGVCNNLPGSYKCECNQGYILSPDGAFCHDKDECHETGMCANGKCLNLAGSFKCVCNIGYKLSEDGHVCIDVNECEENVGLCRHGNCINNQGSFRCECHLGFTLSRDGRTCRESVRAFCYTNVVDGRCRNPTGSPMYRTECCCAMHLRPERVHWGTDCTPCPLPGTESYKELCEEPPLPIDLPEEPGYPGIPSRPGGPMAGINECQRFPGLCKDGTCEDLTHGYRCLCNPGFVSVDNSMRCEDINECQDSRLCEGGQCINEAGSFYCNCPDGYRYDERTRRCLDVDECVEIENACINAACVNYEGGYRCECRIPGTVLDSTERVCIDNRKGMCWTSSYQGRCEGDVGRPLTRAECCAGLGVAWGSPCKLCSEAPGAGDCPRGYYKPDGITCIDLNECLTLPDICEGGGTCINTEGSFRCECPPHLSIDSSGRICQDLREEICYGAYYRGRCERPFEGQFKKSLCCCGLGKAWGSTECEQCPSRGTHDYNELCKRGPGIVDGDIDECVEYPNICVNGRCRNTVGSFICTCHEGFSLDSYGYNCTDIDECTISHNVCGNGTCRNTPGRFTCDCFDGFESTMMMQVCMDIDECSKDPSLCRGGHCINTIGSYTCQCPEGHELTRDGKACKDVDECSMSSGICSNGRCENFMGGYECVCDLGYKPNPLKTACTDIDECRVNNGGCTSTCFNTPGSFYCGCRPGYRLDVDGKTCKDINECEETPNICNGGECTNLPGTHRCICTGGLEPSPDRKSCIDIDECEYNRNICLNGVCKNTVGSYICSCERGYSEKVDGQGCTDDNECELGTHNCDQFATCINTPGSYRCKCNDGFTGNGYTCTDRNECLRNNGGCSFKADCVNTPGSFHCICEEGYEGDGFDCRDVDECSINPDLCENGQCLNYPGGYRCDCDMGFGPADNNHACVDIDECASFPNLCVNGKCENMMGIYRCICNQGYQLDFTGGNCTDIDECELEDSCKYGVCINRPGSYICQCPPGFDLNPAGNGCIDKRAGTCYLTVPRNLRRGSCSDEIGHEMTKATCCCTAGRGWGQTPGICEVCPRNGTEEYRRLCPGGAGFRPNTVTVLLEDVDECQEIPGLCTKGTCVNTFGSFTCVCPQGYELDADSMSCVDVDECRLNLAICGVGTCINTEGNYTCVCPEGHMLMPDRNCMDMRKGNCYRDAYNSSTPPFRSICENPMAPNLTKKVCCCTGIGQGWSANEHNYGLACELCPRPMTPEFSILCGSETVGKIVDPVTGKPSNVNECQLIPNLCYNGRCIDLNPGFRCDCPTGFRYDSVTRICADIDECLESVQQPCAGNARCENILGSYICTCPTGYRLTPSGKVCRDIDECAEQENICAQGTCRNVVGSYSCQCLRGYKLAPSRDRCIDVNECVENPQICQNGTCLNSDGSYSCVCNEGFEPDEYQRCIDIDECRREIGLCPFGHCRNVMGSYQCLCQPGFDQAPDLKSCIDINECLNPRICRNGRCDNVEGSFVCTCDPGFRLSRNGKTCVDIDECADRENCVGGRCRNSIGSYTCTCDEGYQLMPDGKVCMDMRKGTCYQVLDAGGCAQPRPQKVKKNQCCCSRGAGWSYGPVCEICPEEGSSSFQALCPDGYGYTAPYPGEMTDINECLDIPNLCENGECLNMDGSFRCICNEGYVLNRAGTSCVDKNECRVPNACGNGTCTNTEGGFICNCNDGFVAGPKGVCEDIDECLEEINNCAFRCHNVLGSFHCVCPRGYQVAPDGRHCEDVDECRTPQNNCKYACKNLVGTFMCICPEGYRQIGEDECEDINECRTVPGICEHGRCINTRGGYKCDCFAGFELSIDGKRCLDYRDGYCFPMLINGQCISDNGDLLPTTKVKCCCTLCSGMGAWGARCERCPRDGTAEFNKLCPFGCGFDDQGHDIDECRNMPNACRNGKCINTMGSYRCRCNTGYKVDISGSRCIDIDECAEQPSPCQFNCRNTDGSFVCSCLPGYSLGADGRTCEDIDECATNRHNCPHTCINTVGSFHCDCPEGYRKQGQQCIDVDECRQQPNLCGPIGTCVNTPGSYTCQCPDGYQIDETGTRCIDLDECEDELMCQFGCENIIGGYICECPVGFQQHYYWNQCVDVDECLKPGVCGTATCVNTVGAFTCTCTVGIFDPQNLMCINVGGTGCAGAPCQFGCTATEQGFFCTCPEGFQRVGQDHCVSMISPPGATLPPGGEYPHVPAPPGETGVPPGEGCYQCNNAENYDGIPLNLNGGYGAVLGNQLLHLRYRRDLRTVNDTYRPSAQDPLIIDVSGPHSKVPTNTRHLKINKTEERHVIHLRDHLNFSDVSTLQSPTSFLTDLKDELNIDSLKPGKPLKHNQMELTHPDEPITLYIWRHQTGPHKSVLNVIPSLSALKKNEFCVINRGNRFGLFDITDKGGINTLHFTRTVQTRGKFSLEVVCLPTEVREQQDVTNARLVPFTLHLYINIL